MKKIILSFVIIGIPFLTSGCALQDKIAELKMNEMEKIIANANSKEDFHEDTNSCPNNCTDGCDNEHYTSWENYYKEKGVNSTLYKFMENDYNAIVAFKDPGTAADVYAVRVLTDMETGNAGGQYFTYELGRILVNKNNPKKSKCTYNYMAGYDNNAVKWFECSDKSFIESIPQIAKLKQEEYEKYKNIQKGTNQEETGNENPGYSAEDIEFCSLGDNYDTVEKCKKIPEKYIFGDNSYSEKSNEQLSKLRSTTL